jgi:NitT/TauT family transport system substrate-binding protein
MKKLILTLLLAASATAWPLSASAEDAWTHGIVQPKGDAGFSYMVTDGKYDQKNGIKLELTPMQGDTLLLKSLIGGALDSYEGGLGSPMIAAYKGADVRIIGCQYQKFSYAVYATKDITDVKQLKGKKIGVSAPGSSPDMFVRAILRQAGIDPSTDVQFALVGSDSQRIQALTQGIVDGAAASDEFQVSTDKLNLNVIATGAKNLPQAMHRCIYTTQSKIDKDPDLVARFLAAEIESFRYALANRDATIALGLKSAQVPNEAQTTFAVDDIINNQIVDPTFGLYPDKLTFMRDMIAENGVLPKDWDPMSIVADGPLKKALQMVGDK